MAENNLFSTYYNIFKDGRVLNLLHELEGFEEIIDDYKVNVNRVFPNSVSSLVYILGTTFNDPQKIESFKSFVNIVARNEDLMSLFPTQQEDDTFRGDTIYKSKGFTVSGHSYFFHGTSYENYEKILQSGYLKFTNYLDNADLEQTENSVLNFFSFETGNVFVTDDFRTSIKYATNKSLSGVVLCLDLDGCFLENLYERNGRQFISKDIIPIDRLKEAYRIDVIENKIHVNKMEAAK